MEFGKKIRKPIIVVAPDFKSEALTSLVVNHLKNVVKLIAVKTPLVVDDHQLLEDLASFSGGRVVSRLMGDVLGSINPVNVVGRVRQAKLTPSRSVFVGGFGKIDRTYGRGQS